VSLSILTNVSAMQTHNELLQSSSAVSKAMQELSSGLRINTAADDAAGYAISQGLTAQVNGYDQASRNVGDAVSMVQTADTALNGVQDMLQRVRELAVQYQNGDLSSQDQTAIQGEVNQLTQEIGRQAGSTQFNGIQLLNGNAGGTGVSSVTFQVGANAGDSLVASFASVTGAIVTGAAAGTDWNWAVAATGGTVFNLASLGSTALTDLDTAINNVSAQAATLGAVQNRLQYTADQISSAEQNLSASNSQIKDVDMASTMTKLTQEQILQQAGTAMLAQANSQPQLILKLVTG
jgi:flagellin